MGGRTNALKRSVPLGSPVLVPGCPRLGGQREGRGERSSAAAVHNSTNFGGGTGCAGGGGGECRRYIPPEFLSGIPPVTLEALYPRHIAAAMMPRRVGVRLPRTGLPPRGRASSSSAAETAAAAAARRRPRRAADAPAPPPAPPPLAAVPPPRTRRSSRSGK